jgi:hypothetical protein
VPDSTNLGALMGSACHVVFEHLLKARHYGKFKAIIDNGPEASPVINRYVAKYLKQNNMPDECGPKILSMIRVGLQNDFFCTGGEMQEPEMDFDYKSESPKYYIKGFLDKTSIYNNKFVRISDYKSSKSREEFSGDSLQDNIQAKMYSLAMKKKWPHLIPVVDFILLQFPDSPISRVKFTDAELEEFEEYLGKVYHKMENFTEKDASADFAAAKYPEGKGFNGKLLCGWNFKQGFVQSKDEKKKDGSPKYCCPYRFPFEYLALVNDETGEVAQSCFLNETLKPREGHSIIKKKYRGCKYFYPESY